MFFIEFCPTPDGGFVHAVEHATGSELLLTEVSGIKRLRFGPAYAFDSKVAFGPFQVNVDGMPSVATPLEFNGTKQGVE